MAFVVGDDGALYGTSFDQATGAWTALAVTGGPPIVAGQALRLGSVDGVCFQGVNDCRGRGHRT